MRVGRANDTKLIGIDANFPLNLQAAQQRRPHKITDLGLVLRPLSLNVIRISLKISKRVIWRQGWICLRVTFVLRHLNNWLPTPPYLSILWANRLIAHRNSVKHGAF